MAGLSRLGVGLDSVLGSEELRGGGLDGDQESGEEEEEDGMDTTSAQDYTDITEVCQFPRYSLLSTLCDSR